MAKKEFYVSVVGKLVNSSDLDLLEITDDKNCSWGTFKLSVNPEYQKIVNQKFISINCCIIRPETQIRFLNRHLKDIDASILVSGSFEKEHNDMVIYALSVTFLKDKITKTIVLDR